MNQYVKHTQRDDSLPYDPLRAVVTPNYISL